MAGKVLLGDPGTRFETMKRFVVLVSIASVLGMYEYFFKTNPYREFWGRFYPGQWGGATTQIRWGFGRMSGPLCAVRGCWHCHHDGSTAGPLGTALPPKEPRSPAPGSRPMKYVKLVVFTLVLALGMTEARGPLARGAHRTGAWLPLG